MSIIPPDERLLHAIGQKLDENNKLLASIDEVLRLMDAKLTDISASFSIDRRSGIE